MEAHEWINEKMPVTMQRLKLMAQTGAGSREYKLLKLYLHAELTKLTPNLIK